MTPNEIKREISKSQTELKALDQRRAEVQERIFRLRHAIAQPALSANLLATDQSQSR